MRKRIISLFLALVTILGLLPTVSFAAATEAEALGEVDIYHSGEELSYLSVNGSVRTQTYTYYNYVSPTGQVKEIPAYCVNPTTRGVPKVVAPGEGVKYLANERTSDAKVMGIIANGYPTTALSTLKLENKQEAYYATKMALWTYLLPGWDINKLKVNPSCGDVAAAQRVLAAAKWIYSRGTAWTKVQTPELTVSADKDEAYPVTVNGRAYKQQVFTVMSGTWVCGLAVQVAFSDPASVPAGTRIVDMDNKDITAVTMDAMNGILGGRFKVLYPADAVEGQTGSVQLSFLADVYKYAVFYATCMETDKYGTLQNYMCDTDPTTPLRQSIYSTYSDEAEADSPTEDEETMLKIIKLETGTETPLSGARFEIINPEGATLGTFVSNSRGEIKIPVTLCGNYTVIERDPPAYHLLSADNAQNVNVEYGKVATLTFYNDAYGALRIEKYSDTGDRLPGAVVRIKHIESGQTYTQETGATGVALFDRLKPGAYEIVETTAPIGWLLDSSTYNTNVVAGETAVFPLVNKELPGLRIIKYDRKNMELLSGVTFAVYRDGEFLGNFQTDELGEILLTNVEPGTYRAYEVDTGDDGLILDTTPQEVELHAGDGIKELLFFNDTKPGMKLVKVDSADPSKVIPNAVFEIESVAGDYGPEEFRTDRNGEIDLSKLPAGAYVVTEKSCEGYIIDEAQRIIQLDGNEDVEFVFTNTIKPSIRIVKYSSDGSPLPGVMFRISKIEDGSRYLDRVTDQNGEINISDLEPGVYSVQETNTVSDHILDLREYHVELFPGKTSTLTVENQKRPNLVVYKHDADTGEPIPNTVFSVRAADGHSVDEIKTDSEGKATLDNLLPGVYEVSEKSVPAPWLNDADPQLVTLYANRDYTVYFENHRKPTLTVNKVDSITGSPIKGAKFEVWYGSNSTNTGELNSLGTFFSDENGQFTLDLLRDGWYKVTELEPAAGYTIKEPVMQEFYVKGGESKSVTFENVPKNAIIIEKYDSVTGEALPGCTFQLRYLGSTSGTGGTVIGTKVTGINGTAMWTGLNPGAYIVEEIDPTEGYSIIQSSETVMLADNGEQSVITVRFTNAPDGNLLIRKVCSVNPSVTLQNAEFKVIYADGTVIGDSNGVYRTDENGEILITGLKPGKSVVVTETRAPAGFIMDTQPQTVQIKEGRTVSLTFKNQPKGAIIIQKRDSATGQPLPGAEFRVTTAAGCEVGLDGVIGTSTLTQNGVFVTDAQGEIKITNLAPGAYVLNEIKAPDGYVMDSASTNVVIGQGGDTQTVVIKNSKAGTLVIDKRDSLTGKPLQGVTFKVTTSTGEYVPDASGHISSNGLYFTDKDGKITINGVVGTLVVTETATIPGYTIDEATRTQTVVVNPNDTQTLHFTNTPSTTLVVEKYIEGTTTPLKGVTFARFVP